MKSLTPLEKEKSLPIFSDEKAEITYATGYDFEYNTTVEEFTFKLAEKSGMLILDPRPASSTLESIYPKDYEPYQFHRMPWILRKARSLIQGFKAKSLLKLLPTDAKVLDIGCGNGSLLQIIKEKSKSTQLHANDFSKDCMNELNKLGFSTHNCSYEKIELYDYFDAIILNQVIEHFSDPRSLLLHCDHDSDKQYYGLERFKNGQAYKSWVIMSFLGGMFIPIILKLKNSSRLDQKKTTEKASKEKVLDYISIIATQAIIFFYCFYLTGSIFAYLYAWILPLFTVMFGLNTLRSNLEHAKHHGLADQPLLFTFRPSKLVCFFLSPFNMNYHAEHHSYPGVPFYNLDKVRIDPSHRTVITCRCYSDRFKDVLSIYSSISQAK
jgi:SAM-dependent methyltransferase